MKNSQITAPVTQTSDGEAGEDKKDSKNLVLFFTRPSCIQWYYLCAGVRSKSFSTIAGGGVVCSGIRGYRKLKYHAYLSDLPKLQQ